MSLRRAAKPTFLAVEGDGIRYVDREVFLVSFAPDCNSHRCRCRDEDDRVRLDACCQYGADLLAPEKQAILRRASEIASVLKPERQSPSGWFDERDPEPDPDAPDGIIIRTATSDLNEESSGCVFLEHRQARGCGLHLAAMKHGFDPAEIKPKVCRLYPLSVSGGRLEISPDFDSYSCAGSGNRSVYSVVRDTLAQMYGAATVRALDRLDSTIRPRRLTLAG